MVRVVQLLPAMELGGVERGVVELSRGLVAHGMSSVVVSRGGALVETLRAEGGTHVAFDGGGKNPLTLRRRAAALAEIWREWRPDIVHVRSRVPAWLLRFSRQGFGFRVVSTLHGLYRVGWYSRQMTVADRVICPSRAVVDYARRFYAVPEQRLRLIYRGIDLDYFCPRPEDAAVCGAVARECGLQGATVVAIVGRVSALKGHELFLRAVALARRENASLHALVVGDGRRLEGLKRLAQSLGVGGVTHFVGARRDMREIYQLCDGVVSASTRPEAFGRTMAEALAMGCPVVAAAHGGALDIVREGVNGFLFPVGDAEALARALLRLSEVRREGLRETVAHFSLAAMVEATLGVYRELLSE